MLLGNGKAVSYYADHPIIHQNPLVSVATLLPSPLALGAVGRGIMRGAVTLRPMTWDQHGMCFPDGQPSPVLSKQQAPSLDRRHHVTGGQ